MSRVAPICLIFVAACWSGQSSPEDEQAADVERGFEMPVATNAESPVFYPVDLFEQGVEGSVILRLFIMEDGIIVPESTLVAETSGIPELDSAAVAGVVEMHFAPARRNGTPVATLFLQPVHFRHPARCRSRGTAVSRSGHFLLSAETTFSAAHRLPGAGTCEQLHGHNWRVRITVRVDEALLDQQGMGIDFRIIEEIVQSSVSDFDHAYLNDLEPFRERPPTAELIAREVYSRSQALLEKTAGPATIAEVEAWEMAGYRAVYRPE